MSITTLSIASDESIAPTPLHYPDGTTKALLTCGTLPDPPVGGTSSWRARQVSELTNRVKMQARQAWGRRDGRAERDSCHGPGLANTRTG
jgi:hypothetical protein